MPIYEARDAVICDLPLPNVVRLVTPQNTILRFAAGKTIDFGEFCYLDRDRGKRKKGKGRLVNKASFCGIRAERLSIVITKANIAFSSGAHRPLGVFSRYDRWCQFMGWCYSNGHADVLLSIEAAREALQARIDVLRRLIDQHLVHNNTAFVEQHYSISVLEDLFEVDNLARGINLIRANNDLVAHTLVPSEDAQEVVLGCCISLFSGLSDFVLGNDGHIVPYPHAIPVPDSFEREENRLWIFPQRQWFGHEGSDWNSAYDYENGRLFSFDELSRLLPGVPASAVRRRLKKATAHLEAANLDRYHWSRIERALLCAKSFFVIFLAATGANEAPAAEIPWDADLETKVSNPLTSTQGIRSIKYRAGGRTVHFEIGLQYLQYLRRYLEVRRFLLQGRECGTLFFDLEANRKNGREIVSVQRMTSAFYRRLEKLVPALPRVHSRHWRAAKQDYVIRKKDPATAAHVMQHSLSTAINAYSNGTQTDHEHEMGNFLSEVESAILTRRSAEYSLERGIGSCVSADSPRAISNPPLIQPDCKVSEGCLYCCHYRVHADATDTRKLLSARQCVRITARYSSGGTDAERIFAGLLERIEHFIGLIRERERDLVCNIEHEVDVMGYLDPFWAAKIETLIELGMEL